MDEQRFKGLLVEPFQQWQQHHQQTSVSLLAQG